MTASRMTVVIAHGIYLYAQYQDMPGEAYHLNPAWRKVAEDWRVWAEQNPKLVTFVQKEQYDLFDRVNARF